MILRNATFDTRHKIITLDQARVIASDQHRDGPPPAAFVTHMDVLRAAHIHKLQELARVTPGKLFLILTDPEAPLAPLVARAEVAAALRVVDYVVPSPEGAGPALRAIDPGLTIRDEEEDRGRTHQLIEHVRSRSGV